MENSPNKNNIDYKDILHPAGFINSEDFTVRQFVGKNIVLLDFWTYSCINCQRTLPYLNRWFDKYHKKGLTVIGVHTPEFEFEKDYWNVMGAAKKFGIKYPIVLDNYHSTWNAYSNRYWPSKYLIDIHGQVVYQHSGEGDYEETERKIQELLEERRELWGLKNGIDMNIESFEKPDIELSKIGTPEVYLGVKRKKSTENLLSMSGKWQTEDEYVENQNSGAKISINYVAKSVYFVAGSENRGKIIVVQDGKKVKNEAGADVKNGILTVAGCDMYHLIENPRGYGKHSLELTIEKPGLKAYAFTFG